MTIKIDQEGLSEGSPGRSRTDGLATGARVTLTNTEPGTATRFNLPWAPPGDTTALSSLVATEDPNVWTFDPTPDVYGSYLIELIVDEGLVTETRTSRILAVRTPRHRLVIPALNERGDSRATLQNQTDSDNNAIDYIDATLNAVPQAAWWRALHELFMVVDSSVALSAEQGPGPEDAGKVVVVNEAGSSFELVAPGELGAGDGGGSTASLIRASAYLGNPGTGGYTLSQQGYDSYADAFSVRYPGSVPNAVIYDIEPLAGDPGPYLLRNATYTLRSAGGRADAPLLPALENNTDVTIEGCSLAHPVTGYGSLRLRGTRADSSIDQGQLDASDTTLFAGPVAVYWSARFERCSFGGNITVTCAADADGVVYLSDCTFYPGSAPSFTFLAGPGVVRMDARSKFLWDEAGGGTVTNGTVIVETSGGASLPDGTYDGQPLAWDGTAWVPLVHDYAAPDYRPLRLGFLQGIVDLFGGIVITAGGPMTSSHAIWVDRQAFSVNGEEFLNAVKPAGQPLSMGFFGAAGTPRPTITGATTQEQVDSLVEALALLGLVTDGR